MWEKTIEHISLCSFASTNLQFIIIQLDRHPPIKDNENINPLRHQPIIDNEDINPLRNQTVIDNKDMNPLKHQPIISDEDTNP
jgi:hypothetical protein